jgi:antitoxin ChpS
MMFTTNLRKVGGSIMLAVPPAILDLLHLHAGATVGLSVDHGCLVVEPMKRTRYTLDELLAQCDGSSEISTEERAWQESKPVGRELL